MIQSPVWFQLEPEAQQGFQEAWFFKLNDVQGQRALWLRFALLSSQNGFRRTAEIWAAWFEKKDSQEISKTVLKQTYDISELRVSSRKSDLNPNQDFSVIQIHGNELSDLHSSGTLQSKGHELKWNFTLKETQNTEFNPVPPSLRQFKILKNTKLSSREHVLFTGSYEINGKKFTLEASPGMMGHRAGPRSAVEWVWGHCNTFIESSSHQPIDFLFEGWSAQIRFAPFLPLPRWDAYYFFYRGKEYLFHHIGDLLRSRSKHSLTDWKFQVDREDLSFRGHARAEHRDFVGLTLEDTDGSLLYAAHSKLSSLTIHVYRRGKLETTVKSTGSAALEVVSRKKNPYVPLMT